MVRFENPARLTIKSGETNANVSPSRGDGSLDDRKQSRTSSAAPDTHLENGKRTAETQATRGHVERLGRVREPPPGVAAAGTPAPTAVGHRLSPSGPWLSHVTAQGSGPCWASGHAPLKEGGSSWAAVTPRGSRALEQVRFLFSLTSVS